MKKKLMLLIASFVILPGFVLGGDVVVNNVSGMNTECISTQSKTYWFYLTESMQRNPYDNFKNTNANSYITKHDSVRTGTSVDIWRNGNVISNCTNWNRTSTAVKKSETRMIIQNQDGCMLNIPPYSKFNDPHSVDAQIHYNIGFVQFNYGSNSITDRLYYTNYGNNYVTCFENGSQVSNGSSCPTSNITYSKEYFHTGECINYKVFWCGDGLVNSETGTTYNNGTYEEECDPNAPGWSTETCSNTCQIIETPTLYCGDGIINQDWEDCDPGSGNFWNGCSDSCKLMTPSCNLTANPNQGNIPLTTSINGTTNSWWGRIVYLNFGDGNHVGNGRDGVSFPQNHTYSTTGTFYLTGQVLNIYPGEIRTGVIRPVAYCSISVTAIQSAPTISCGDGIINQDWEDCDPGSGNFGNGCNSNCKLMTPSCNLTANPNQGNIPLTTTISGTTNSWWGRITKIYFGDGESYTINNWNPILPVNHTYNTEGIFYLTGVVTNVYNGQIRTGAIRPVAYCSINVTTTTPPPVQFCGDGNLDAGEQCDPGSGNFGNGCNENCKLMIPTCTLTVDPNQGDIPLNTTINGITQTWATYTNLNFGDGQSQTNPHFTLNHTYSATGTFNLTLTVQNNYNGEVNGTKPTATCSANIVATQPGSPVPYLLKEQRTGGMNNFTTHQINVELGEVIEYKINFGNSGTVAATGKVWDILPPCTTYLTSSIVLPNGVTYNGPVVGTYGSQDTVQYKDFLLQPGQGGYMLVQAQIRGTGMNGMTSCSNVTSYLNTGYFNLGGTTLQSDVVAVRPKPTQKPHLIINKELLSAGDMTAGSTVEYRITLTNDGNATYYNAYILDILPNAIQYQTSSIQNITNYLFEEGVTGNNEYYIKYYNFNLNAGQSAVVYLTGILKKGFNFDETVNCAMTSGAVDCEEFPLNPMPFLKKWQKTGGMTEFTDEIIQVELGETITYKVDFGNIGNRGATGQVWDILPPCVKYVSSSIYLPSGTSYSGPHTGQQGAQDFVMYKDFFLDAGQTGYMLVEAEIKGNGVLGLNCSDTRSYLNTGYFKFVGGKPLSSDVLAERPETPTSTDVSIEKTVDMSIVKPGDIVTYTIAYTNEGSDVLTDYSIIDYWPNTQLEFVGVIEPLTPAPDLSNLSNNVIRREFTNQTFNPGEIRIIKIQGKVR